MRLMAAALVLCAAAALHAVAPNQAFMQQLRKEGKTEQMARMQQHYAALQARYQKAYNARVANGTQGIGEPTLYPKGVVIMVNFTDVTYNAQNTQASLDSMLNSDNYTFKYRNKSTFGIVNAKGSARQYFIDQSGGEYAPEFTVVGPYNLSHDMAYYGKNDRWGSDQRAEEMVAEACRLADADIDYSQYDSDNDGEVDFVMVFYAGYGEADGGGDNTIWPHRYWLDRSVNLRLDNKKINTYACFNELGYSSQKRDGIGTPVHEFMHILGLPDLYATNESEHKTLGDWDIMDGGSYNNDGNCPPACSAYERFFFGWLTPTVLSTPQEVELQELQSSNTAYMITANGTSNLDGVSPVPTEFFLLENRQKKTGTWDYYIPGHGLLITRIRYDMSSWQGNTVNSNAINQRVDIIEADGMAPSNSYGKQGDAFPTATVTSYSPYADYPITNIREQNGVIRFNFMMPETALEDLTGEAAEIVALYDVSGRLVRNLEAGNASAAGLPSGTYIGRTAAGKSIKLMIQ